MTVIDAQHKYLIESYGTRVLTNEKVTKTSFLASILAIAKGKKLSFSGNFLVVLGKAFQNLFEDF